MLPNWQQSSHNLVVIYHPSARGHLHLREGIFLIIEDQTKGCYHLFYFEGNTIDTKVRPSYDIEMLAYPKICLHLFSLIMLGSWMLSFPGEC